MMTAINCMRTGIVVANKKKDEAGRGKYNTEFKLKVLADVESRGSDSKASVARKYGINASVITHFEKEKGSPNAYTTRLAHKKKDYLDLVRDGKVRRDIDIAKEVGVSQTTVGRWKREL